jgi:DNA-binding XRE family transcriptional regulator
MSDHVDEICPRCHGFVWHRREACKCDPPRRPTWESVQSYKADFLHAVGARIAACRKSLGLSLDKVASETGLSKAGLWQIEKGRSEPRARTLVSLATTLKVTTDHLLLRT